MMKDFGNQRRGGSTVRASRRSFPIRLPPQMLHQGCYQIICATQHRHPQVCERLEDADFFLIGCSAGINTGRSALTRTTARTWWKTSKVFGRQTFFCPPRCWNSSFTTGVEPRLCKCERNETERHSPFSSSVCSVVVCTGL